MSEPVSILGSIAVGFAVSYLTEKLTGSETLGMVAGLAAGGWAGNAIAGYQAASAAGTAATTAGRAGSALGVAGGAPLGGAPVGAVGGAVPSPIAAQAATAATGATLPGAVAPVTPPPVPPPVTPPTAGKTFLGFSPDELLKTAAGGISGMAKWKSEEEDRKVYEERTELARDELDFERGQYARRGAYGVTNTGRIVPINAGQQLQAMNERLGYQPFASTGTMTNISTIQRPEGGYLSQFRRFGGKTENA